MCEAKNVEDFERALKSFNEVHASGILLINGFLLDKLRCTTPEEVQNTKCEQGDHEMEADATNADKSAVEKEEIKTPVWEPWHEDMIDNIADAEGDVNFHDWTFRLPFNPESWTDAPPIICLYRALYKEHRKVSYLKGKKRNIPAQRIKHLNKGVALLEPMIGHLMKVSLEKKDSMHDKAAKKSRKAREEGADIVKGLIDLAKRVEDNILPVLEHNQIVHESMKSTNQEEERLLLARELDGLEQEARRGDGNDDNAVMGRRMMRTTSKGSGELACKKPANLACEKPTHLACEKPGGNEPGCAKRACGKLRVQKTVGKK